ncbi:MAG: WD domain, G-beta repeat [Syntrophaceae bacterium PtaU1.Bin231]|nr:MAG: WD domain, G-beta repeat [Syntrophaceae bacterium PtaU1.Bin231]HOG16079.1 hypothetical protein [Syntrophales bacterium]
MSVTGTVSGSPVTRCGWSHPIAVSADGKTAATGGDGTLRLWDIEKGTSDRSLQANEGAMGRGWVPAVALSSDGRRILTGGGDNTVRLWNRGTGERGPE